jgi:hypothetical protein
MQMTTKTIAKPIYHLQTTKEKNDQTVDFAACHYPIINDSGRRAPAPTPGPLNLLQNSPRLKVSTGNR